MPPALGVSGGWEAPTGNGARETSVNSLRRGSLRARNGTCLNPMPTRRDRPLPLLPARPAASSFCLLGLPGTWQRTFLRSSVQDTSFVKEPLLLFGKEDEGRDGRQPVWGGHGGGKSVSLCSGPAGSDPRNHGQVSIYRTFVTRQKGERMAASQEPCPLQNSLPVMPREQVATGRTIYAKKGQKRGGRGSPRKPLVLPRTLWVSHLRS